MKRLTNDTVNNRVRQYDVELVGDCTTANERSLFRHLVCGTEYEQRVAGAMNGKLGCTECVTKKHTTKSINDIAIPRGIILVDEYINNRTPVTFKRMECGHTWKAMPDNIVKNKNATGCPECAKNAPVRKDDFLERISHTGITLLSEYKNTGTKVTVLGKCGHTWKVLPANLMKDRGCPSCCTGGYKPALPGYLYVLHFEGNSGGYIKVGITNNLNGRLREHNKNGRYTIVHTIHNTDGQVIYDLELIVKQTFERGYVSEAVCPDGHTETFSPHLLEDILTILRQYAQVMLE
jgi:hypothetical protein